jgi:hypothetical protein
MLSFVICSIDPRKFAAVTASLAAATGGEPHEIVGIHDARSLCEGWNRGLKQSRGDPVVFCHDDIELYVPDLPGRLARHLERFDIVGIAGTDRCIGMAWPHAGIAHAYGAVMHREGASTELHFYGAGADAVGGIQSLDGVFLATRRSVAEALGFDEATFDGWHGYDADFTFRAHLAGRRLGVALDLPILHGSRGRPDGGLVRYHFRFETKFADRLVPRYGAWVDIRVPVAIPGGVAAAYERANLDRLHAHSRREAQRLDELASKPFAARRHDSCPCGSGLRYRDCHGALRP